MATPLAPDASAIIVLLIDAPADADAAAPFHSSRTNSCRACCRTDYDTQASVVSTARVPDSDTGVLAAQQQLPMPPTTTVPRRVCTARR